MDVIAQNEAPPPVRRRFDYATLASVYNDTPISSAVRLRAISNVTNFRNTLVKNWTLEPEDFHVYTRGKFTYVVRKTQTPMIER